MNGASFRCSGGSGTKSQCPVRKARSVEGVVAAVEKEQPRRISKPNLPGLIRFAEKDEDLRVAAILLVEPPEHLNGSLRIVSDERPDYPQGRAKVRPHVRGKRSPRLTDGSGGPQDQ